MTKVRDISILADAAQNFAEAYRKRHSNKLSTLEKQLIAGIILLGLLFLIFVVLFFVTQHYYNKVLREKICSSYECIDSAMTLLQTVDFSQDPCQDFYKFACGKFSVNHPIHENDLHNSWFSERDNQLNRFIMNILTSPATPLDLKVVRQTKEFYRSCTNKSELNEIGLQPLYEILEMLELPKSVPNNETVGDFNLGRTLALAQLYLSQDILVAVSIAKEPKNASLPLSENTNIFKISPGVSSLGVLDIWKPDGDMFSQKIYLKFLRNIKREGREKRTSKFTQTALKNAKKAKIKFMSSILEIINDDLDQEGNSSKNYNLSDYTITAQKIMNFTTKLQQNFDGNKNDEETMGKNKTEHTTFSGLEYALNGENSNTSISNRIDWKDYISALLQNYNKTYDIKTEPLLVENIKYFKTLSKTLEETPPETIQRYIWWKIVERYAKYTTTAIRTIYVKYYHSVYGESAVLPRSQVCTSLMRSTMGVALSYEMAKFNNFTKTSQKVIEMLRDIKTAFKMMVNSVTWMDARTKSVILDKAKAVSDKIGFASWMTNPKKIIKYYHGLDLKESEFLKNIMRVSHWEVQEALKSLGPIKNSTELTDWFINPLQVNAYYSHTDNAIFIPPGILRTPFYFRGLESLNYGAIGTILGHELTHGFDTEGKNYNKFGKQEENLWPNEIVSEYETRAKCFIKQYENYTLYDNNILNGSITLAENIADNGGIRESFKAYQLYAARHDQEPKLPGFENFTHEQLLFLSYANMWCEVTTPKYYRFSQDSHSPQRVRVLVTLQNMKEFSEVYKCSENSFMNPSKKCMIW